MNDIYAQYQRLRNRYGIENPRVQQARLITTRYGSNMRRNAEVRNLIAETNAAINRAWDYDRRSRDLNRSASERRQYASLSRNAEARANQIANEARNVQVSRRQYMGLSNG